MAASSQGSFFRQLPRAMAHPLPAVLAVGTVIAVVVSPLLAIPGAVAWAAATGVIAGRRASARSGPDVGALPPSLQADLLDVTTALDRLQEAARSVPAEQKPMFEGIQREAAEIRSSVVELAAQAGALHRHLEATRPDGGQAPGDGERRERMLARLAQYRETLQSLEASARNLADRAVELAAGAPMEYDVLDDRSPERKISEMKASMAAIEEVMRTETEMLQSD
ncbi:MAG: hypothetical protein ACOCX2_05190 [Armatimonadota bacterium]